MAGSPVMAVLDTSEDIVDCPDTFRSDQYCRTALGVQKDLVKSLSPSILPTCYDSGHAQLFIQHFLVFWQ